MSLTGGNQVTMLMSMGGGCCSGTTTKTPLNLSCLMHKHLFLIYAKSASGLMTPCSRFPPSGDSGIL